MEFFVVVVDVIVVVILLPTVDEPSGGEIIFVREDHNMHNSQKRERKQFLLFPGHKFQFLAPQTGASV